jgi:rubrerythrin
VSESERQTATIKKKIKKKLIHILQMAYSGEKSAALAYQGHAGAVQDELEKSEIQAIEADEWHHRSELLKMLSQLSANPHQGRELLQTWIGLVIKPACYCSGWFFPMLGAWLLEEMNIQEYRNAASYAQALDLSEMAEMLADWAEVEARHARYFKAKALSGQGVLSPLFVKLFSRFIG